MKKHKPMREIQVVPRGVVPHVNGEAAPPGTAAAAQNLREHEQALVVTGQPAAVGQITAGDRLLLIADGHYVTGRGASVLIDGTVAATASGDIMSAHAIGQVIVVVATGGFIYLTRSAQGVWTVLDPADALPSLTFTAGTSTSTATIDAYTFASPYSQWRAPLAGEDVSALTAMLRSAWSGLLADVAAEGRHAAPMLVRWAVRMVDGNYLWMSDPVRVGDETLANTDRLSLSVTTSGNNFTGTAADVLPCVHYALVINVVSGIAPAWRPLVAAIDVLATDEASLFTASRSLDYRCLTRTVGPRDYLLEVRLTPSSAAAVSNRLAASPWRLIATAPASATSGADFTAPVEAVTMTSAQCAAVGTMLSDVGGVVCATAACGRLYCCTGGGDVVVSAPGNAFVEAHRRSVIGAAPIAIAAVTRSLYNGGFGRYPVYVFTSDGIYAIPQTAAGTLGEARLVDRTVIAPGVPPAEAWRDVWFVSRHGHLCRLSASRVDVVRRDAAVTAMAWCNAHRELWLLPDEGYPEAVMDSGASSVRTVEAVQLYGDPLHAVAVLANGAVLDLEQEQPAAMSVGWRSHPVAVSPLMGERVQRVVWHLSGEDLQLTLRVTGQRGIMASEWPVSVMAVDGDISQPLAAAPMRIAARTLCFAAEGTAPTGTMFMKTLIYCR